MSYIRNYSFKNNGKRCSLGLSDTERPRFYLSIEDTKPRPVLDIFPDEYGVYFLEYLPFPEDWKNNNGFIEKLEISEPFAKQLHYDLQYLQEIAERERKAKEILHYHAVMDGDEPKEIVCKHLSEGKTIHVARGIHGKVLFALNCATMHSEYGYVVKEGFEKKSLSEIKEYHKNLIESGQTL